MPDHVLRPYHPTDAEWLIAAHQRHYSEAEGFDATFGPLVAQILTDFARDHDPDRAAGWVAMAGDRRMGSIFCVPGPGSMAKLRLFYLDPAARGTGLAQRMIETCVGFARGAGYSGLTLWTHESHAAAGRVYARNGFALVASAPVHSFGVDLVEQTWQIAF